MCQITPMQGIKFGTKLGLYRGLKSHIVPSEMVEMYYSGKLPKLKPISTDNPSLAPCIGM